MNQPASAENAPFLVRGRIGATPVERPVPTIEAAERIAQLAADTGEGSWASWMVLPADPAVPAEPILLFGRLRAGITGESHRVVHAVVIVPGHLLAEVLTATCGARLARRNLDFVELGHNMPCERCLQRLGLIDQHLELPPEPHVIPPASTPAGLPDMHPEVRELLSQLGHDRPTLPGRGRIELPPAQPER
jgi:hypothetical protein